MNDTRSNLNKLINEIESPEDLAGFLERLAAAVDESPEQWSNLYLDTFLEAMSAWITDSAGNPDSVGYETLHEPPTWRSFAKILLVAAL